MRVRRLAWAMCLAACDDGGGGGLRFEAPDVLVVDVVQAGPSGVGIRCSDPREETEVLYGCRGGQECLSATRGYPGGYCSQDCRTAACPTDAFCVSDGASRYCVRRCTRDDECRVVEGYRCDHPDPSLPRGCIPEAEPSGTQPDGSACDDPATRSPRSTFAGPVVSLTHERSDTAVAYDPFVATSPRGDRVLVVHQAVNARGVAFTGTTLADTSMPPARWSLTGALLEHEYTQTEGPQALYDGAGVARVSWRAETFERPNTPVRLTRSDDGATWREAVSVNPESWCVGGCDAPSLAWTSGSALLAAWVTRTTRGGGTVVVARSDDGGETFAAPVRVGDVEPYVRADGRPSDIVRVPAALSLAATDDGRVAVVWTTQNRLNPRAALGDVYNDLRVARSTDGGRTFAAPSPVVDDAESVVLHAPTARFAGDRLAVVHVRGATDGRWRVVLSTTADGARWIHRDVHDDRPCASHGVPALATDVARGVFHVLWLDNRYGEGEAAYARCPFDDAAPCLAAERVSDQPFRFTTGDNPLRWHGTRSALAVAPDGRVWAAWSDTRTGGPAVYLTVGTP